MFHELGLVEQWGSGVQRMIATCREAGLASPVWEEVGLRLRVTIYTAETDSPVTDTAGAAGFKRGDGTPDCRGRRARRRHWLYHRRHGPVDPHSAAGRWRTRYRRGCHGHRAVRAGDAHPPGQAGVSWTHPRSGNRDRTTPRDDISPAARCAGSRPVTRARSLRRRRCRRRPGPARQAARRPCRSAVCAAPPARVPGRRRRSRPRPPLRPGRPPDSGPRR